MANYFYKGKEVRSRSDRDRDVKLSWAHTVTLKHTDINFRVMDSVAKVPVAFHSGVTERAKIGQSQCNGAFPIKFQPQIRAYTQD